MCLCSQCAGFQTEWSKGKRVTAKLSGFFLAIYCCICKCFMVCECWKFYVIAYACGVFVFVWSAEVEFIVAMCNIVYVWMCQICFYFSFYLQEQSKILPSSTIVCDCERVFVCLCVSFVSMFSVGYWMR